MSDDFEKLLKITENETVELTDSFKNLLSKELVFGQTRYVCRYGTLSDGHEKITSAQRYYQALKEMWNCRIGLKAQRVKAKRAQADLLDAQEALNAAKTKSEILRGEAAVEEAQEGLLQALTSAEDIARQLDEYNKIRLELQDEVRAKYPNGIEQAEYDNWKAVAEYRMIKEQTPGVQRERLDNVPLPELEKAKLGLAFNRIDAVGPLMVSKQELLNKIPNEDPYKLEKLIHKVENTSLLEHN